MTANPPQRATEVEVVARAIYACEGRSSFWALHYAYTLAHTAITALDAHRAGGVGDECTCPEHGNWLHADDIYRMTRELDVAMNGDDGALRPALCDIFRQLMECIRAARASTPDGKS